MIESSTKNEGRDGIGSLSVKVTKCVYPNVRINLNSFTTATSTEYGKCNIVCGPNDIEFR